MTFQPEANSEETLQAASLLVGREVFELHNQNPFPEGGTLGFIMGTAFALGNMAAVYTGDATPKMRKDFERIVLGMVKDAFRHPVISGELQTLN